MAPYWLKLSVVIIVSTVMLFYPLYAANSLAALMYYLKEFVLDLIARLIAKSILAASQTVTVETIAKIGRGGGAIIEDWTKLQAEGQYEGENLFRNMLATAPICNYLKESAYNIFGITPEGAALAANPGPNRIYSTQAFNSRSRCTTNLSAANIAAFKKDFSQGGWDTWEELIKPQNNLYGLVGDGIDELQKQRSFRESTNTNEGVSGGGFFSNRQEQNSPEACAIYGITKDCIKWKDIKTAGQNLRDSMSDVIASEKDWLTDSDELAEVIIGLLSNLVADMLWSSFTKVDSPGDYDIGDDEARRDAELVEAGQVCIDDCMATRVDLKRVEFKCESLPVEIDCELICTEEGKTVDPDTGAETNVCLKYEEECSPNPEYEACLASAETEARNECTQECNNAPEPPAF